MLKPDGLWKRDGGGEAGAEREARLPDVSSNQPRALPFKDQSWLLAPASPVVHVTGFALPVVEGRGGELQFPAGNAEQSLGLVAFLIRRCLDC